MTEPLVSVIMPVYNCEQYIGDAINSILNQTYNAFEFLIIDDASTDNTKAIIKSFKDSRIELTEKPKNTGYTQSLNYGLAVAKGKYIARMDGDDIAFPERIDKQVSFMESHPDVVVCGTNYQILGSKVTKLLPETHEDLKIELLENTCFGHPTVMIRKHILDEHHLCYDITKEPAEDYALWVSLLHFGKFHNLQDILMYYRVHDHQVSQKRREVQLQSKLLTRIAILQNIDVSFSETDLKVLKNAMSDQAFNFEELRHFIRLKKQLITSNYKTTFFKPDAFDLYILSLERRKVIHYFLKRTQFTPKIYGHYLKIKKHLDYRLPFKTDMIILAKCMLFFKAKKTN